jgi:hypothetical protein
MEAGPDIIGQRDGFRVAKNLDGFARGVNDDAAIGASRQMFLEVDSHAGVEDSVEIAR